MYKISFFAHSSTLHVKQFYSKRNLECSLITKYYTIFKSTSQKPFKSYRITCKHQFFFFGNLGCFNKYENRCVHACVCMCFMVESKLYNKQKYFYINLLILNKSI